MNSSVGMHAASTATTTALCELLTPLCSLQESCQLWREFARQANDDDGRCCRCGCRHCCHDNWDQPADSEETPLPLPPAAAEFPGSAADVRRAAYDNWLAAKRRSGTGAGSARATAEAAVAAEAEERRKRREEGAASYASWLQGKKRLGSGHKSTAQQQQQEEQAAAGQEKKVETQAAIDKWRERKNAELAKRRRDERQLRTASALAKEADASERRTTAASAMEAWGRRKADNSKAHRTAQALAESEKEAERQQKDEERRATSSKAFDEWSTKKRADKSSTAGSEMGGRQKKLAWRPNATSRKKY